MAAGSGWRTISQTVREVDEAKVQDCKEDIDTLLVFAGLFSAVLSAFVVESHKLLLPDNSDVVVQLLQQVVDQSRSYRVEGTWFNSTAPYLAAPVPFHPGTYAIQVNVLWFASLTISLMAASFGILVKQWLREYMAMECISPQARLRTRHFHYSGIRDWKVFEIAAILPLLLQLALACFFVGLCFFSLSVHRSVGKTIIPLVCGWTILFVLAILAPLLSPRCPFKIPLLVDAMKFVRVRLVRRVLDCILAKLGCSRFQESVTGVYWTANYKAHGISPFEEEAFVMSVSKDVDILTEIDATLIDDEFFVYTMWRSLLDSNADSLQQLLFLKGILGNRLECNVIKLSLPIDLRNGRLMATQWQTVVDLATELIEREISRVKECGVRVVQWSDVMVEALLLALSPVASEYQFPDSAFNRICSWMQSSCVRSAIGQYLDRQTDDHDAGLLLFTFENNVKRWWKALEVEYIAGILDDIALWLSSVDKQTGNPYSLARSTPLMQPPHLLLPSAISSVVLRIHKRILLPQIMAAYGTWYHQNTTTEFTNSLDVVLASFLDRLEAVCFVHTSTSCNEMPDLYIERTARDVLLALFGLPSATRQLLRIFSRRRTLCLDGKTSRVMQYLMTRTRRREPTYISVAVEDGSRFAFNFVSILDDIRENDSEVDSSATVMRLCYLALIMVIGPQSMAGKLEYGGWRIVFSRIALHLACRHEVLQSDVDEETKFLAGQCLYQIDILEAADGDPHGLSYHPPDDKWPYPEGSVFGRDLIRALSHRASGASQYSCVQRLWEAEENERDVSSVVYR